MRSTPTLFVLGLCWVVWLGVARGTEPPAAQPVSANLPSRPVPLEPPVPGSPEDGGQLEDHAKASCPSCTVPKQRVPEFFGDQAPIGSMLRLPSGPILGQGGVYIPSVRYFKISDNDSPQPQNRSYFSFNYFYNLYGAVNHPGNAIQHTRIHREIWGVEWADKDGDSSFGLRLPLNTYNAANTVPGLDGTSTDIGDLSIIFKRIVWQDPESKNLLSAGLAVIPTTGPGTFGGSGSLKVFHNTVLQPFCGWIWSQDRFYVQGFTAVDAPTDLNDVVMLNNDFAIGYFLLQKSGDGLTALVPTAEVHLSTPLNHRGVSLTDPAGNPNMLNFTGGIHAEYKDKSSFGIGFSVPLTGPRPFEFEILVQHRCRY